MKTLAFVFAAVLLPTAASAGSTAADTAAGACQQPEIPAVSTSQAGADRVKKAVKEWEQCLERNPGTNPELVAKVSAKVLNWVTATSAYAGGQANGQAVAAANAHEERRHQKAVQADVQAARPQSAQASH